MAKDGNLLITIDDLGNVTCDSMTFESDNFEVFSDTNTNSYKVTWIELVNGYPSNSATSPGVPFHLGEVDGVPFVSDSLYKFTGQIYSTRVGGFGLPVTMWRTIKPSILMYTTVPITDNPIDPVNPVIISPDPPKKEWIIPVLNQIFN